MSSSKSMLHSNNFTGSLNAQTISCLKLSESNRNHLSYILTSWPLSLSVSWQWSSNCGSLPVRPGSLHHTQPELQHRRAPADVGGEPLCVSKRLRAGGPGSRDHLPHHPLPQCDRLLHYRSFCISQMSLWYCWSSRGHYNHINSSKLIRNKAASEIGHKTDIRWEAKVNMLENRTFQGPAFNTSVQYVSEWISEWMELNHDLVAQWYFTATPDLSMEMIRCLHILSVSVGSCALRPFRTSNGVQMAPEDSVWCMICYQLRERSEGGRRKRNYSLTDTLWTHCDINLTVSEAPRPGFTDRA